MRIINGRRVTSSLGDFVNRKCVTCSRRGAVMCVECGTYCCVDDASHHPRHDPRESSRSYLVTQRAEAPRFGYVPGRGPRRPKPSDPVRAWVLERRRAQALAQIAHPARPKR